MNSEFAKKELDKLTEIAKENKDGFIGCYFSRIDNRFIGTHVGMSGEDAVVVIDKIIGQFNLDRAALSHHIAPAIILPFGSKKDG